MMVIRRATLKHSITDVQRTSSVAGHRPAQWTTLELHHGGVIPNYKYTVTWPVVGVKLPWISSYIKENLQLVREIQENQ
jgi:hypothetical protein